MKNKKQKINDPDFYNLANGVAKILEKNNNGKKLNKKDFTKKQKFQVEKIMELEEVFRKTINSYKQSDKIYYKFLIFIKVEKGNILMARPFFRENSKTFGEKISPAFKEKNIQELKNFHINYKFMLFVIENWKGNVPPKALDAWEKHQEIRKQIIENSMPMAINEAMKFYKAVPKNHVTLMDMINASVSGLCIGVDKWVGPFRSVFRSVCLSRMKANIMDIYNQTVFHFYPSDKKIIYKYNLLKSKTKDRVLAQNEMLENINEYLKENNDKRTLKNHELQGLMGGAFVGSVELEEGGSAYDSFIDDAEDIEEDLIKKDLLKKVLFKCQDLSIFERKIIKLKGVDL